MSWPPELRPLSWAEEIERLTGSRVIASHRLAGDLGGATRLTLADGRVLVAKQGSSAGTEGAMLEALREAGAPVPCVLHCAGELLLMEFLEAGDPPDLGGWRDFARVLESLHAAAVRPYGWPADYRLGSVHVANGEMPSWTRFWGENRLLAHAPHLGPVTGARLGSAGRAPRRSHPTATCGAAISCSRTAGSRR